MLGLGVCGFFVLVMYGIVIVIIVFFFFKIGVRLLKMDVKKGKVNLVCFWSFDVIVGFILFWYMVYGYVLCLFVLCFVRNCCI